MNPNRPDPTTRFSDRVANYVRYRPGYPEGVLDILREEAGLTPASRIADIGSGTGISSELFLRNDNPVSCVEPNTGMRRAAEARLHGYPGFRSVEGTAEATTLPDRSVDHVVAGQAFHWFDRPKAKQEFVRILEPGGWAVLLWNTRRTDSTSFLRAYEALLRRHGTDYREVHHNNIDVDALLDFFPRRKVERRTLYNEQRFDFAGLLGRLLSSSYVPNEQSPAYAPMVHELEEIFERYRESGEVCIEYDTEIYFGRLV